MTKTKSNFVIILFAVFLLCVLSLFGSIYIFYSAKNAVLGFEEYETEVIVGDYVGINVDTDKVYFGTVFPGSTSARTVYINTALSEGKPFISIEGNISDWIYADFIDETNTDGAGRNITVRLYSIIPENAAPGRYMGVIRVYILKQDNWIARLGTLGEPLSELPTPGLEPESARIKINISNAA